MVQAALRKNNSFKLTGFMPQWKQRGLPIFEEGRYAYIHKDNIICQLSIVASLCLRASPEENNTMGFFVAKIERLT